MVDLSVKNPDTRSLVETDLQLFELAGVVKWFDASKGFGFIVPDNGTRDVFIHLTALSVAGIPVLHKGTRMHFEAVLSSKGMQVFRVINIDDTHAVHPSQRPPRTHVIVQAESGWEKAYVKWFDRNRGFGFLTRGKRTPDIFVHMDTLHRFDFTELRPGQMIEVRWGVGSKGVMAAELRPSK